VRRGNADDFEETFMARKTPRSGGLMSVAVAVGLFFLASTASGCASQGPDSKAGSEVGSKAGAGPGPDAGASGTNAQPSGSGSAPEAASLPSITVQRTGGFAGRKDTVTVAASGEWSVTDRTGAQKAGALTRGQLTTIRALATDPRLAAEAAQTRPPTRCRDAFAYQLTVGGTHVEYVDCPVDPQQPTASIALVKALVGYTISATS
jgi:hypothetical protein